MKFMKLYKRNIDYLKCPKEHFSNIKKKDLDSLLGNFLKTLLLSSLLLAITTFIFGIIKAIFFKIFYAADINFVNVINYNFGLGVSLFFAFLFFNTVGLLLTSVIINFFSKKDYVLIVKILLISFTPILVIGWFPKALFGSILWSFFLLYQALRV